MGIDDKTKQKVAIKMVNKKMIKAERKKLFQKLKLEIYIMRKLKHPNILTLIDVIKT